MQGEQGIVVVTWSRAELVALREAIEVTPGFEGRTEARDAVRAALRERRVQPVKIEQSVASELARRIVPVDVTMATARSRLERAVRVTGAPAR